jgi:hydrogenase maturation protease
LHVTRELERRLVLENVDVIEIGTAGLSILDHVRGYDRLILVDAIVSGAEPGTVLELAGADIARAFHLGPGHDADLPTVLTFGERLLGELMPRDVVVIAVEAEDVVTVSSALTPKVSEAVKDAAALVEALCEKGPANAG